MNDEPAGLSITMIERPDGVYWTFDDVVTPQSLFSGPFATEELATEAAIDAIGQLYKAAVEQMLTGKE